MKNIFHHLYAEIEICQLDDKGLLVIPLPLVPRNEVIGGLAAFGIDVVAPIGRKKVRVDVVQVPLEVFALQPVPQ